MLPPWIDDLQALEVLNLGSQFGENEASEQVGLLGTIPVQIGRLLRLRELNLEMNALTGTLPPNLCSGGRRDQDHQSCGTLRVPGAVGAHSVVDSLSAVAHCCSRQLAGSRCCERLWCSSCASQFHATPSDVVPACCYLFADNSKLMLLNIRANRLSGNATVVESCGNLIELDIGDNSFTGPLPASVDWDELSSYRACRNQLTGTIPSQLATHARILEYLDISYNQLSGSIPNQITILSALKQLDISGNKFTGTLTEDVWFLPSLTVIALRDNHFVGTIPPAIGCVARHKPPCCLLQTAARQLLSDHVFGDGHSCARLAVFNEQPTAACCATIERHS